MYAQFPEIFVTEIRRRVRSEYAQNCDYLDDPYGGVQDECMWGVQSWVVIQGSGECQQVSNSKWVVRCSKVYIA